MSEELKPCPFCGGGALFDCGVVACDTCGAMGAICETDAETIAAWNRRAAKPAVPDDLVELLRELRPNYGDVGSRDVDVAEKQRKIDAAIALLSAAPPLPVVQGWISVKDRLPEDGQTVAFVVDCKNPNWDHLHGRVLGGLYLGTKNGGFSVPGLTVNASYWMPLSAAPTPPAAPKEPT